MRLRVVCAACGALAFAWGAMAQPAASSVEPTSASATVPERVRLEYKLKPGMELIYKFSGTESGEPFSVFQRSVVADTDAATGMMLVARVEATKSTSKASRHDADTTKDLTEGEPASVCRLDRSGNPIVRKLKGEGLPARLGRQMLLPLDRQPHEVMPLPAAAVAVGDTWENTTDSGFPDVPLAISCKLVSTLAEISTVNGHKCAVIRSTFTPSGKKPRFGLPDVAGTEEVETIFDVEGGFCRSAKYHLVARFDPSRDNVPMTLDATSVLDSLTMLPPEEAARQSSAFRALDAAVGAAYDGQYDKAVAGLEALKPADVPEAWKDGFKKALATLKDFAQFALASGAMSMFAEKPPSAPAIPPAPSAAAGPIHTCYVEAIDVDSRQRIAVTFKPLLESELASLSAVEQSDHSFKLEFQYSPKPMIGTEPMSVLCWAEAPDYGPAMFSLKSSNKLFTVYMESPYPTVPTWRMEQFAYVIDLTSRTDAAAAKEMDAVLNGDTFFKKFQETYWYREPWQVESEYLHWKQLAARDAAKNVATFGEPLAKYYYGGLDKAAKLAADEQIRMAARKQIEQGPLYEKRITERETGFFKSKLGYHFGEIRYEGENAASVDCNWIGGPLAGIGYKVELKRVTVLGVTIWIPTNAGSTWMSRLPRRVCSVV